MAYGHGRSQPWPTVTAVSDTRVRLARPADAEALRTIYNQEVTGSTVTFDLVPRTLDDQLAWIDEHSGAHPAIVASDGDGTVLGFASLSPYRSRPAYATTVEDSVYVHRDHRGRGVGKLLLGEIVSLAGTGGFHAVMARIVGTHDTSIALHRSCGFELVGVEREIGRKFGQWLDVALMQLLL
ncbi:MAG: GNAT family N-acetyltransferase [Acidimicrobiales bacterium]